jgi:hypothetical protein
MLKEKERKLKEKMEEEKLKQTETTSKSSIKQSEENTPPPATQELSMKGRGFNEKPDPVITHSNLAVSENIKTKQIEVEEAEDKTSQYISPSRTTSLPSNKNTQSHLAVHGHGFDIENNHYVQKPAPVPTKMSAWGAEPSTPSRHHFDTQQNTRALTSKNVGWNNIENEADSSVSFIVF